MLPLLLTIVLVMGLCIHPVSAEGGLTIDDKEQYRNMPGFIDLNLSGDAADDGNFVVMREGAMILNAESGMSLDIANDKTTFTLYNPTDATTLIEPGKPVAFIDKANNRAPFFLPTSITAQPDRMVITCSQEDLETEQLFEKVGIDVSHTFAFYKNLSFSNPAGTLKFDGRLKGEFFIASVFNGSSFETASWVSYDLTNAVLEFTGDFHSELPIAKIPFSGIPGMEIELGVGLALSAEQDTKVSFSMKGGKTGFSAETSASGKPKFSGLSQKHTLTVDELIGKSDFEVCLTLSPTVDILSVAGLGADIVPGMSVSAELVGDEGGNDPNFAENGQRSAWHVCKELSCLQGEIHTIADMDAWIWLDKTTHSVNYDLFSEKYSDFHYSDTFKEFELKPCEHYLYPVKVCVTEKGSDPNIPMENVTVAYTEVPPYASRRGADYIKGVTDKDGCVYLYMPAGRVNITAAAWLDVPSDSEPARSLCDEKV